MKFLVDAQLPMTLTKFLLHKGFDAIHTDDLPNKERTSDKQIREVSVNEGRIVITKDSDFMDSYLVAGIPKKLLIVTTGNIRNKYLFELFSKNINRLEALFKDYNLVEMNNEELIGHE